MKKEVEEINTFTVRQKGNDIKGYKSFDKNEFLADEDVIGLDANVLVDIVESTEFRSEIKMYVQYNVLKIYTTNIALGEAKHVLIKKRSYAFEKAIESLKQVLNEFNVEVIKHNAEGGELAEQWFNAVKQKMYIKKFDTFLNDCRILANLFAQGKINLYITEDTDIEKAVKLLKLPIRVKIIGEASNLSGQTIKDFFRESHKALRKRRRPF